MEYDGNSQLPVSHSFEELSAITGCERRVVVNVVKRLKGLELIKRTNETRGRVKNEYAPNVELLQNILRKYVGLSGRNTSQWYS
jgi:predicted transcriptional regulator